MHKKNVGFFLDMRCSAHNEQIVFQYNTKVITGSKELPQQVTHLYTNTTGGSQYIHIVSLSSASTTLV